MKLLDKTKWIIVFAACAVIAIAARPTDMLLAKALYGREDFAGSFFYTAAPALPFALSSFSCAVMMSCRSTRTTRAKNQMLTVLYAVLSVLFAAAASYYPFIKAEEKNFTVIAAATLLISGCSIFVAYTSFKKTYQKIVMTRIAKTIIFSTLAVTVICLFATLIPQRATYEAIVHSVEKYGHADGPFESTVPFIAFVGASAPILTALTLLSEALPKLKFSGKWLFAASCLWTLAVVFGSVLSGKMFLSEAIYGALVGYLSVFCVDKIVEKKENE